MRRTVRRSLATTAVLALAAGTAACNNQDATENAGADVSTATPDSTVTTDDTDVAVDSMVGLEVTAVGNVSDLLSDEAIRIDRDGLGNAEDKGEVGDGDWAYDYDYDYYEYDNLTAYDDDFSYDLADEGVLVVSATGLENRTVDEAVRVSGTVRRFDKDTIESVYDLNLENDVFDIYEDSLVIVADSVQPASAPAAQAAASDTASPSGSASS